EVRAALLWSVNASRIRDGLRLAVLLDEWWRERGLAREGRMWLFRLFEKITSGPDSVTITGSGEEIPAAELAAAYHTYSRQAGADNEFDEQLRLLLEAERAAWRTGAPKLIARVSAHRGDALL